MDAGLILLICMLAVFIPLVVGACFFKWINKKRRDYVLETSERIKVLNKINEGTLYRRVYNLVQDIECSSKRKFDQFDYLEEAKRYILANIELIKKFKADIQYNTEELERYKQKLSACGSQATQAICSPWYIKKLVSYRAIESELFEKLVLLNPVTNFCLVVSARYASPQGRNSYKGERVYNIDEMLLLYEKAKAEDLHRSKYQRTIQEERARMTDSLRYDILRRDGFRCVLCGASSNDGVKLHIDHIFPVSKGGKTVPENLRTLCERCNRGKSAKIEG